MSGSAVPISPQIVGRYALYSEIASGGMATVHFGRLLGPVGFSRPVAIKKLHPQYARDPQFTSMFIDEARLASRIHHPNVVSTLDIVQEGSELLLVMEYVQGESLARLLRTAVENHKPIPVRIALAIASQVLHGLHAAHEAKTESGFALAIVHRDVSPQNIIVGSDGVARILDFGIARASLRLETTQEGRIKGKIAYMSPEQLGGGDVDRRTDIYAASVMLWELLAGRRLYLKAEPEQMLMEKMFKAIDRPSMHRDDVSDAVDAVTLHGLEKDPAKRFATAREMAIALERFGPLATSSEVGEWVEATAKDTLSMRSLKVAEFESAPPVAIDTPNTDRIRAELEGLGEPGAQLGRVPISLHPERIHTPIRVATPPASATYKLGEGDSILSVPRTLARGALASLLEPPQEAEKVERVARERKRVNSRVGVMVGGAIATLGAIAGIWALAFGSKTKPVEGESSAVVAAGAVVLAADCPHGMVRVPAGRFYMGSDEDLAAEKPSHQVSISAFCIDELEVTVASYKTCSDQGDCKRAGVSNEWDGLSTTDAKTFDPLCNARDASGHAQHPVNCVTWEMADRFCRAHDARLPSEAEWEFAARGPDGRKYPWGDEAPNSALLNACGAECIDWGKREGLSLDAMYRADDGFSTTAPVGSFPKGKSRYGVQDLVGNVSEWVADWYGPYGMDAELDPKGPASGKMRVVRGGAWNASFPTWVRPTFRYRDPPDKRSYNIGFRCAK